jgi:hypothetical protein
LLNELADDSIGADFLSHVISGRGAQAKDGAWSQSFEHKRVERPTQICESRLPFLNVAFPTRADEE